MNVAIFLHLKNVKKKKIVPVDPYLSNVRIFAPCTPRSNQQITAATTECPNLPKLLCTVKCPWVLDINQYIWRRGLRIVKVTEGSSAGIRTVSLSITNMRVAVRLLLGSTLLTWKWKLFLVVFVCALFTYAVTDGKWLYGKCAESNGDGCTGICLGKSIKIASLVAGLRVNMYPGPPKHEAGVAIFDIKLYDYYWDCLTWNELIWPWFYDSALTNSV